VIVPIEDRDRLGGALEEGREVDVLLLERVVESLAVG